MRYLTISGLVTFALALCVMLSAAQSIPSGSYQQTCSDINVVNDSTLAARCQGSNGEWRSTRLTNFQDCRDEIVNDNGSLRCARNGYNGGGYGQGGYGQGDYPSGDYAQTCRNIRTNGNRLDADCQKRNGGWRSTSLNNINQCTSGIANDNGHLVCGKGGNGRGKGYGYDNGNGHDNGYGNYSGDYRGGAPSGTYTQTCRNIRTNGNRLDAECETRNGDWRKTSLNNINQCTSAIANDNGHLVCPR